MFKHLQYIDEISDKFWKVQTNECTLTVTYGRNGTSGQSKSKSYETEEECIQQAEKLIAEKIKKGYSEDGIVRTIVTSNRTNSTVANSSARITKEVVVEKLNKIIEFGTPQDIITFLEENAKGNLDVIKKQLRAAKKYWINFVDLSNDPKFKNKTNYGWGSRGSKEQQWVIKLFALATFNATEAASWSELFDVFRNCTNPEVLAIFKYAKPQWINKYLLDNLRKNEWNYVTYENLRDAEALGIIRYDEELYAFSFNSNWNNNYEDFLNFIKNDDLFVTRDFPLVFKYATNIQNIYLNYDYNSKDNILLWNIIFDDLLQNNKIDKREVFINALEIQTKNWNTSLKSFFQKVVLRIKLKEEEIISHQELFFPLLHSEQSLVVNFAVDFLKSYITHPKFKMDEFLNWTDGIFMRNDCKGSIKVLLIQWDKLLKVQPEYASSLLLQCADVFVLQDLPLQERVTKLLLKYIKEESLDLNNKLIAYNSQIIGKMAAELKHLIGDQSYGVDELLDDYKSSSGKQYYYVPTDVVKLKEAYVYPENWNEILFKIGEVIGGNNVMDIEIMMNAWVMQLHTFPSDYKEQLKPYIKQLESKYKESQCYQHFSVVFLNYYNDPSKIYYNDDKYSNYSKWASTISESLILCQQHIMNKVHLPLLCLPTHIPFWIDPEVLIQRIIAYEEQKVEINLVDLSIALNRTVRENLENVPSLLLKVKNLQIQDLVNYALGFSNEIRFEKKAWYEKVLSGTKSKDSSWIGIWANLARSYHHDQSFEAFLNWKDIPFAYQPYRTNLQFKPHYYDQYDYQTQKYTPVFLANKIQYAFSKYNNQLPTFLFDKDLFERQDKLYLSHYLYKDDFLYMHSLMPLNTESLSLWLNASINTVADYSGKKPLGYLKEMLWDFFRFNSESVLFLACTLFAKEKEVRALAVEVLIIIIDEQRLPVYELGKYIGQLMNNNYGPIGRSHEVLSQLRDISSVHHHAVLQLLDQLFINYQTGDKMSTNFKKIVELYYDFIHKENYTIPEEVHPALKNLMKYKSLHPILNKIKQ